MYVVVGWNKLLLEEKFIEHYSHLTYKVLIKGGIPISCIDVQNPLCYLDILDTSDMTIERLHILQVIDMIYRNKKLVISGVKSDNGKVRGVRGPVYDNIEYMLSDCGNFVGSFYRADKVGDNAAIYVFNLFGYKCESRIGNAFVYERVNYLSNGEEEIESFKPVSFKISASSRPSLTIFAVYCEGNRGGNKRIDILVSTGHARRNKVTIYTESYDNWLAELGEDGVRALYVNMNIFGGIDA